MQMCIYPTTGKSTWLALPASEIRADLDLTRDVENLDLGIEVVTRTKRRVLLVHHDLGGYFKKIESTEGEVQTTNLPTSIFYPSNLAKSLKLFAVS